MKYNQGNWMNYYYYYYYCDSGFRNQLRIGILDDYYSGAEDGVVCLLYVPRM